MSTRLRFGSVFLITVAAIALTPAGASATFPGVNGRIVFTRSTFSGGLFLASMEPDGSDQTRHTEEGRNEFGASWSPDGTRLIFGRTSRSGQVDLFISDADGSNVSRLTDTEAQEFQPAFAPDGEHAVYEKCRAQCDLFIIDVASGDEMRLTSTDRTDEVRPDWSVDDVIVYDAAPRGRGGDVELFTINADGTNRTRLTDNRRQDLSATWSPDGSRIVFSRCGFESDCDMYTMDPNGEGVDRVTNTRRFDEFGAIYSPDGSFIAFTRSRGEGEGDIYRMSPNGADLTNLTETPNRFELDADWQPLP